MTDHIRVRPYINGRRYDLGIAHSIEERDRKIENKRAQLTGHTSHETHGITPDDEPDIDTIWRAAFEAQAGALEAKAKRQDQRITLPDEPIAIAFLSDIHFGSASTDYRSAKADAEIIRDTPGMYAVCHGDLMDNWIVSKLAGLQRGQAVPFDAEVQLCAAWLRLLKDKLLVVVSGNHDNWTYRLAGIDAIRETLRGTRTLYDREQVIVDVQHASQRYRILVRHKWRYGSIFNATHGLEVGWDRGDVDYDIAIGGHTHIATVCRPFYRHGKMRYAVLTGTYKVDDPFGIELGVASSKGRGCGAMIFTPKGERFFCESLSFAADLLGYLRSRT